jgi:hypothetical protein
MMDQLTPEGSPLLFHYTSEKSLYSILASNQLWFNESRNMNDYTEGKWFINEILPVLLGDTFQKNDLFFNKIFRKHLQKIADIQESYSFFIGSFCNHFDRKENRQENLENIKKDLFGLLSMWRSYGNNGYAIIFNKDKLLQATKSEFEKNGGARCETCYFIQEVDYVYPDHSSMENFKSKHEEHISKVIKIFNYENNIEETVMFDGVKSLYFLSSLTKHLGFEEEKEFRIPIYSSPRLKQSPDVINSGKTMCKYIYHDNNVRLIFEPNQPKISECIEYIIIGPGTKENHRRKENNLKYFLMENGLDHLVDRIRICAIPFV